MSQSIEKLALDLQSQVKTLAEEKSTYTERMKKMEDAMEAYRAKCDEMEATMKEYNERMANLVKAMEEKDDEEEDVPADLNAPIPEPVSKKANELGGVNEQVLSDEMPKHKRERVREGGHAEVAEAPKVAEEAAPAPKAEEVKTEPKAEEAAPAPVAEAAPAPTPVAEATPAPAPVAVEPKVEAKAEVTAVKSPEAVTTPAPSISPELLAKIAEVDALKAALAAEVEARKEALASVTKVKGEFESLAERIAKVEKDDLKAEKVIAKKVADLAVEPVAAAVATEGEKTPEQVVAEFNKLAQSDAKAARKFYLANEETIRTYSFGKKAKRA